jgi:hypothetical protein
MMNRLIIGFISVYAIATIGCIPEECGKRADNYIYDLVVDVSISPAKEVYRVGDTISMEAILPSTPINRRTGEIVRIADQELAHLSWLTRIDTFDGSQHAERYMKFIPSEKYSSLGVAGGDNTRVVGDWVRTAEDNFGVGYRFVLLEAGVYQYSFNRFDRTYKGAGDVTLVDECPNGKMKIFNQVNGGANNNWELKCESNELFCTLPFRDREDGFDRIAGYIFKVVE